MEFLLIASAHFLALLSPGPDFFLIVQASVRLPVRYAFSVCAGIAVANAVYLVCAVAGLEVVRDWVWLMTGLRYLGAMYLILLGILLLRAPRSDYGQHQSGNFLLARHLGKQFLVGFMSGILNPKNIIFYLALFTLMVSDKTDFTVRFLYALWMTAVVFLWDIGIVLVIGRENVRNFFGRSLFIVEKISGGVLTIFGLLLPFT